MGYNTMLQITAKLENLTNLQPAGGCDDPNFRYRFKMKCEGCGLLSEKESWVTLNVTVPTPNRRDTTNLVQKCKNCGRQGTLTMIPGRGRPMSHVNGRFDGYSPLMLFHCNGLSPENFVFGRGWKAESRDGTKSYSIRSLTKGEDYSSYDEDEKFPIKVINPRAKFERVKGRFFY